MSTARKGVFIVLEGGEGVGKTTQIRLLKERLPEMHPDTEFVFTREPGGSPFAEQIRTLVVSDAAGTASGRTLIGLLMAARADHVENTIMPALARGAVVICDRYLAATYAYQVIAQSAPELEEVFWAYAKLMPLPDMTLLFELDPETAAARIAARSEVASHFDARPPAFHALVREGFTIYFSKATEQQCVRIDAAPAVEDIWSEVYKAVSSGL